MGTYTRCHVPLRHTWILRTSNAQIRILSCHDRSTAMRFPQTFLYLLTFVTAIQALAVPAAFNSLVESGTELYKRKGGGGGRGGGGASSSSGGRSGSGSSGSSGSRGSSVSSGSGT